MATREETKKMIEVIKQAEEALVHMCQTTSVKDNYRGSIVQLALVALREEIQKSDPYAHLKAAAQDPTKQIRFLDYYGWGDEWRDSSWRWRFTSPPNNYEIRDKPKVKKVKLLAYFGDRFLQHMEEGSRPPKHWNRVPSEDKEIEVEV